MAERRLTSAHLVYYTQHLMRNEKAESTIEKYLHDVRGFMHWLGTEPVTREAVSAWKEHLLTLGRAPSTINGTLAALNGLFRLLGWEECRAHFLKCQRRLFRDARCDLTKGDYARLVAAAKRRGQRRLALVIETICATGIRVSELRYITREAVQSGCAEIRLKGKIRTVLLPKKLCQKLLAYARAQKNRLW